MTGNGNLGSLFERFAGEATTALVDLSDPARPREIGFDAFDRRCNAVARGLSRAGLRPGDRVGLLSLNRVEYLEVLFGAMRAGVVPVPLNIKLT